MKEPKIETLISCMHHKNMDIARNSNTSSDVLIINQCDNEIYSETLQNGQKIRMYSTEERGLSRSRNKAIECAAGEICLFCDDDEKYEDDYVEKIERAYERNPDADLIAFRVLRTRKEYWTQSKRIGYLSALKLSSVQLTFKRRSIIDAGIKFDVNYGSGTSNGAGEEHIFLYDCLKSGLKIYYDPAVICRVENTDSQWFSGFNRDYFLKRGLMTKRLMGRFPATLYAGYFVLAKYKLYRNETSAFVAGLSLLKGIYFGRAK